MYDLSNESYFSHWNENEHKTNYKNKKPSRILYGTYHTNIFIENFIRGFTETRVKMKHTDKTINTTETPPVHNNINKFL